MTTIHLVRHGRTVWHAGNRYAGATDVALDDVGREQAARLGPWAADAALDRIVCSDLGRARETAAVAAAATDLPLEVDARLREVDFGEAEGLTADEQSARFPEARAAFVAAPASAPLPGGEAGTAVAARALAAIGDVVETSGEGTVLVVAHTTTIRLTLCALLGIPLDDYRRAFPSLGNVTRTTLRVRSGAGGLRAGMLAYDVPIG